MALYSALLLLTIMIGLGRVVLGPARVDRLAQWQEQPALRDVALLLGLLAAVASAALVQLLRRSRHD